MEIQHQLSQSNIPVHQWVKQWNILEEVPFPYLKLNQLTYEQWIYLQYLIASLLKEKIMDRQGYSQQLIIALNKLDLSGCEVCALDHRITNRKGENLQLFIKSDLDYLNYNEAGSCLIQGKTCLFKGSSTEIQRFIKKLDMNQVQYLEVSHQ